ncbi:MAG: glycerol-3-phosphate acyltransferase [Chlorobiales bacterium]|jgi:acyl phosphate:glycerol-3-phosphate acyltransferase|nr:glycerol-3-phosphate acyltransferase [Chlorobiales bacterium]
MNLIALAAISYLIGSVPFAYIFVRLKLRQDVRQLGSGNVGAMNSFEVTGSKLIGILVGLGDALKGVMAVMIAQQLFGDALLPKMVATLLVMLGHNYSVWLKFKGGRGLATAAGATLLFVPSVPLLWGALWVMTWLYSRKIHFANIWATAMLVVAVPIFEPADVFYFAIFLCGLILLRHKDVMRSAFQGR